MTTRAQRLQLAFSRGYDAAAYFEPATTNPYSALSAEHSEWEDGHMTRTEEMAE